MAIARRPVFSGAPNAPLSDFAASFDGNTQSLNVIAGPNTPQSDRLTVAFWFRSTQSGAALNADWNAIPALVATNDFSIGMADGTLRVALASGGTGNTGPVADGEWHYATATFSEGQTQLYLDGSFVQSFSGVILSPGALNLALGRQSNNSNYFQGNIDHLQVFPTALSAGAIQALYERTTQSYCMATSPATTTINNAFLRLDQVDRRGGLITRAVVGHYVSTAMRQLRRSARTSMAIPSPPMVVRLRGLSGALPAI
ncbi:LamG domain-containing protein [Candidatus Gracilibacteria bacterium]|nr:LamG domain-containing protein [Candidatus Gracilibacteria bacterium]